jgi:hypothetical protein
MPTPDKVEINDSHGHSAAVDRRAFLDMLEMFTGFVSDVPLSMRSTSMEDALKTACHLAVKLK